MILPWRSKLADNETEIAIWDDKTIDKITLSNELCVLLIDKKNAPNDFLIHFGLSNSKM